MLVSLVLGLGTIAGVHYTENKNKEDMRVAVRKETARLAGLQEQVPAQKRSPTAIDAVEIGDAASRYAPR